MTLTHEIYDELKKDIVNAQCSELSKIQMTNKNLQLIYSVSKADGKEKLYFSIGQKEVDNIPQCKGLGINKVHLYEYSMTDYFCELYQKNIEDTDVFEVIIEDVRKSVNNLASEQQLMQVVSNVLAKWKSFFSQEKELIMSKERQQGLYGELLFLKYLIEWYGISSVLYWTGADYETHDYYVNNNAVEVKTTSTKSPYKMHISSEFQLDDTEVLNSLFVVFFALRKSSIDGESLPEIIQFIRSKMEQSKLLRTKFDLNLQKYGYFDGLESKYVTAYHLRETQIYQVKDGFLRIIKQDIPRAISRCTYDVLIDMCSEYIIEEATFKKKLKGGEDIG